MKRLLEVCLLAFLLCCQAAQAQDLAIVGATIMPSPDAPVIADGVVLVRDGRIVAVGARDDVALPADATVIDGSRRTLVAGFWNSHVHLINPGLVRAGTDPAADVELELRSLLTRWGFTSAFEIAGVSGNALALRRRIDSGEVRGPMLLTVDAPFYPQDGTPIYIRDFMRQYNVASAEVATAEEAAARAKAQLAAGADGSKLFAGAIVGGKIGVLPMDVDIARSVVQATHAAGKPVFAHPTNLQGVEVALQSGVDILAHTAPNDGPWSPELVQRLVAHRMALIPSLKLFEEELKGAPQEVIDHFASATKQQLKAFAEAGGQVLFGTDVGYIHDADTVRELALMQEAGLDWRAILASLTTAPAQRFGYAGRKGRIAEGMDADLVLLGQDPADDARAFADVLLTLRGGEVLYRSDELDKPTPPQPWTPRRR
ncbi:amidohydrolase family protein [Pseudoxanthomonas wuyuanensis]